VRYGAQSASDGENVYIFGGFSDDGDHNDLWVYSTEGFELIIGESDSSKVPRARYCAAFDFHDGFLYLFGGRSRQNPKANFSDLWRFDLEKRKWELLQDHKITGTQDISRPGYHAKSSVCVVGDSWYIWGGEGPSGHVSDFWRYDLVSGDWLLISPARDDDPIFW
jgi:hypothetical protein